MFNFRTRLRNVEEEKFALELLAVLLSIRNVPGSYPENVYFWLFSHSLQANVRMYLKLGHDRFLLQLLPSIIH
jgi:hypothetical protein